MSEQGDGRYSPSEHSSYQKVTIAEPKPARGSDTEKNFASRLTDRFFGDRVAEGDSRRALIGKKMVDIAKTGAELAGAGTTAILAAKAVDAAQGTAILKATPYISDYGPVVGHYALDVAAGVAAGVTEYAALGIKKGKNLFRK